MIRIQQLTDAFVEVADTLVADFDLIDFMHTVAEHAQAVSGSAAAGLMLRGTSADLHQIGASTEDARLLELFQVQNAEGPCYDAFRTGEPVSASNISASVDRWPAFAPRAAQAGFATVYAFPMRLRDDVIGALNVFGRNDGLSVEQARVTQALADVATIGIIQQRALARAGILTDQLEEALRSRIVIEQAKGAVARTFGITVEEAFSLLRSHARSGRIKLTDLAQTVVTSPTGPEVLRGDPPG